MKEKHGHRQGSVFYRLFWTYCILISIATLAVSSVSYALFFNAFKQEIGQLHQHRMLHAAETIQYSLVTPAAETMLEICRKYNGNANEYGSFTTQGKRSYSPLMRNLDMLKGLLGKASEIQDIHVYYLDNEILLSTAYGLRLMGQNSLISYDAVPWIQPLLNSGEMQMWYRYQAVMDATEKLVYCHTYPIFAIGKDVKGIIAVEMKYDQATKMLDQITADENLQAYLLDSDGRILISNDPDSPIADLHVDIDDWQIGLPDYHFYERHGQILSTISVPGTSWTLVYQMEASRFYMASTRIFITVLCLALLTLLFGYLLAYVIANRVYRPIQLISARAKEQVILSGENSDYDVINQAISKLSHQVGELQTAITLNAPMVLNQIFSRLLSNQPADLADIQARLRMVQADPCAAGWNVLIVHFSEKDARCIQHDNRNYITYSVIAYLEQLHDDQLFIQAVDDGKMDVAVIVGSRSEARAELSPLYSCIESFVQEHFMLQVFFCVGEWTDSLTELHYCYETAALARCYQWFDQRQNVFLGSAYLEREGTHQRIDNSLLKPLEAALEQMNTQQAIGQLQNIQAELFRRQYHYTSYHDFLVVLIHSVITALQKAGVALPQDKQNHLMAYQSGFSDINHFFSCLEMMISHQLQSTAEVQRSTLLIGKVKQYIACHLREDLSLDILADQVHLTPRYLSRLFKQETGVNFTAYVNDLRLAKGEELLKDTDLTVQQIAFEIGYHTPAYFISQFSNKYGTTPHQYRIGLLERAGMH